MVSDRYNRKRNATISIRVSYAEKDWITNRAHHAGKTITSFIVEAVLKSERPDIQSIAPILRKLNQIQRILQRIEVEDKSLQAAYMSDILSLQNEIYSAVHESALKGM